MSVKERCLGSMVWLLGLGSVGCQVDPPVVVDTTETGATNDDVLATTEGIDSTSSAAESSETGPAATDTSATDTSATDTSATDTSATDTSATDTSAPDPICGDGLVEGDEVCDDGGDSAVCNADCTLAVCGDGVLNATAGELCDDGGESALCNVDCSPAVCGDGVFNATASEACDGAGRTAACNVDCTLAECGDGLLNLMAGEACDDAGESASCNADCSLSSCGDGITNLTAGEACDDEGVSSTCDDDCTVALCGDLLVNSAAGEACDGTALAGSTCLTQGFAGGELGCGEECAYDTSGCYDLPGVPTLVLGFSPIKQFDFSWVAVVGAEHYELLESAAFGEPYVPLGGDILGESISITMPLHLRHQASYVLRACNGAGCTDSAPVSVVGSLAVAVGYFKYSINIGFDDQFGYSVALSGDGSTLAVGALGEDSNATGIGGNQANNSASGSGAVYVFVRDAMDEWSQQAYVKASNTGADDLFGVSLALSDDGSTLVVGASSEDSEATGIDGDQANDSANAAGAAYVFVRSDMGVWSQQAYVKASNTGATDLFGGSVAVSGDGDTLAVGARGEDSSATGIGGDQADDSVSSAGAVYVFVRSGMGVWSQQAYVKASNPDVSDEFSSSIVLSDDGNTLAVTAWLEDSNATGIDGDQANDTLLNAGAVYVFVRSGMGVWSQQAYVKASNTDAVDHFGRGLALSGDGNTLAAGAPGEDSTATGIDGDEANNGGTGIGAAYVFMRSDLGVWSQQAYVKPSTSESADQFGWRVALSDDGDTFAVSTYLEDGNATGIGGNEANNGAFNAGAAYVFTRSGLGVWSQRSYVKASNTDAQDYFGYSVALSGDGHTLAVGAYNEDGNSSGIGGNQLSNALTNSGAVYLY